MFCEAANRVLTFLVDSGSDLSLCKENVLHLGGSSSFSDSRCAIKGVGKGELLTLGRVFTTLKGENYSCPDQLLHMVSGDFPLFTDGILGRDFLERFKCKIDYGSWLLFINFESTEIAVPMHFKIPTKSSFVVAPRCELIQAVQLDLAEDGLILNDEIAPGVFLANAIVPRVGVKHVKILNTTDKPVTLGNFNVKFQSLSDYNVYSTQNADVQREPVVDARRIARLREILKRKLAGTAPEFRDSVLELCLKYHDIFHLEGDRLSVNNFYEQDIKLLDDTPVYKKNFRLPQAQRKEVAEHVQKLIKDGHVEPSNSPYNNPIFLVPKKSATGDRKTRLVVDFRALNSKIRADSFPLPNITEILDQLGRARWFSCLDLQDGFFQIPLKKDVRHLCSFSLPGLGSWQYTKLPFGIKVAPNSFMRMMTLCLSGLEDKAFCYVDDVITWGCSVAHHNKNLEAVFARLRFCNLKLNIEKCEFLKSEIAYLGHKITDQGIFPHSKRIEHIDKYPEPCNSDEVLRFIAFCNFFRKFLPNFASVIHPLRILLRKNAPFVWGPAQAAAFQKLKFMLKNPPLLKIPEFDDPNQPFVLCTDSSDFAYGAVLLQGSPGSERPIAYASKSLTPTEIKKPIIEKELLAIHWAIKYFRPILYSRFFILETDHRPLVSLFSQRDPSSKMTRVRLDLEEYFFEIRYKPGKLNVLADALSRIKLTSSDLKAMIPISKDVHAITRSMTRKQNQPAVPSAKIAATEPKSRSEHGVWEATSPTEVKNATRIKFVIIDVPSITKPQQMSCIIPSSNGLEIKLWVSDNFTRCLGDAVEKLNRHYSQKMFALSFRDPVFERLAVPSFKEFVNKLLQRVTIILFQPPREVTCATEQADIIKQAHENSLSGHTGIKRTLEKIRQRYFWKNMNLMVKSYVSRCPRCQLGKVTLHSREPLTQTDTPTGSFDTVEVDTCGPAPCISENGNRYFLTFQCNLTKFVDAVPIPDKSAPTVARALVHSFFLKYGFCRVLRTDMGTEYVNQLLAEIAKLLSITHKTSVPYHHETIGSVERNHRVLNEFFRTCTEKGIIDWENWLPYYVFSFNTCPSSVHNFTPYELVYGKLPTLPYLENVRNTPVYNLDNFAREMQQKLAHTQKMAHDKLVEFKQKQNDAINATLTPCNFKVGDTVKLKIDTTSKWQKPYSGPYRIVHTDGVNSVILKDNRQYKTHNNRLRLFQKC